MAALSTWWARPISATAAKMMWPQWVNFIYNWHWNLISVNSSYKVFQHKLGNVWSQTAHKHFNSRCKRVCQTLSLLGVVCPLSVLISDMLICCLFIYSYIALCSQSVQLDNPCCAARCGGGWVVPVQGFDAENGWEYSAEGSQRHQPGESSAGHQTGWNLLMNQR